MLAGLSILAVILAAGLGWFIFYLVEKANQAIRDELHAFTRRVNEHLEQTARLTQESGTGAVRAIGEVYTRLGALEESTHKIYQVGQEIGKLQELLRAPKARGGFGEWMLQDLLEQMLPKEHFKIQHQFRSGVRVDAALFIGEYVISVDSKFPFENFERLHKSQTPEERKKARREFVRDVKRHIDAIAERYIAPSEGTLDFALMYIPAESVYYELIAPNAEQDEFDLSQYSLEKRVIPVSPNSFYAYLQVVLMGLRGLKVDQRAREITNLLSQMKGDFKQVVSNMEVLGSHLNRAQGGYEKLYKDVNRFDEKLGLLDLIEPKRTEQSATTASPQSATTASRLEQPEQSATTASPKELVKHEA